MQARYPNVGNPSPGEIFAAYKDLPQVPGGMQILQNIRTPPILIIKKAVQPLLVRHAQRELRRLRWELSLSR